MTWDRFKSLYYTNPKLGLSLDISRMPFPDDFLTGMQPKLQQAFADMAALEGGAIANPDENRMVGHYWLRNADLAPDDGRLGRGRQEPAALLGGAVRAVHPGPGRRPACG